MKMVSVPLLKEQLRRAAWLPLAVVIFAILGVVAYVLQNQQLEKIQNTRYALAEIISSQQTEFSQEVYLNEGAALEYRVDSILKSWSAKYPSVNACVRLVFPRGQVSLIERCSIGAKGKAFPFSSLGFEKSEIRVGGETLATIWFAVLRKPAFFDLLPPVLLITILLGIVGAGLAHRSLVARIEARILMPLLEKMREDEKKLAMVEATQMIAHDLRKPFRTLRFALHSLISSKNPDASKIGTEIASDIEAGIRSVNAMLADIIDMGKDMQPRLGPVSPTELVQSTVESVTRLYPHVRPSFSFQLSADTMVRADREQAARVLGNLIENAIQAVGKKGRIAIETETVEREGTTYVAFSVRNDGSPIPLETRDKIFTPYFTTKKRGTGLGLAIVEKIVTNHGGTIECESSAERGTIFRFTLPADCQITAAPKAQTPGKTGLHDLKHRNVLIFDDEQAIHAVWRHYAQEHSYQTFCHFRNWEDFVSQEAYELARDAVAFVDIRFGNSKFDGRDIARFLRGFGIKKICAITSDEEGARASGLFDAVFGKEIPRDFSSWVA